MKMFVVLALAAVAVAEPEADPALVYSTGLYSGLTHPYSGLTHAYSGLTHPYAAMTHGYYNPLVYKSPVVTNVAPVAAPVAVAASQVVTNYKSPTHYTAHATPLGKSLGLPKYIAKNGPVEHVVHKREAEAEAEADPALFYSTHGVYPTTYSHGVLPTTYSHGVVPYSHGVVPVAKTVVAKTVAAPAVTYSAYSPLIKSVLPTTYSHGVLPTTYSYGVLPTTYSHAIHKREADAEADAEADPALFYSTHGVYPTTYTHGVLPTTYTHGVVPVAKTVAAPAVTYSAFPAVPAVTPLVKSVAVPAVPAVTPVAAKSPVLTYSGLYNPYVPVAHAGVYKAIDQSNVAITPFGATHPSNIGLCFNNEGVQVSC